MLAVSAPGQSRQLGVRISIRPHSASPLVRRSPRHPHSWRFLWRRDLLRVALACEYKGVLSDRKTPPKDRKHEPIRRAAAGGANPSATLSRGDRTGTGIIFPKSPGSRLDRLERRLARIETLVEAKLGPLANDEDESQGPRPGPKPNLSLEQLLARRDWLIETVEHFWPELRPLFRRAMQSPLTCRQLEGAMQPVHGHMTQWKQHLLQHVAELQHFLRSSGYSGDPRQVANAMAGLPEYKASTSLRICRSHPSQLAIGQRALRDYLSRKHPSIFRRLLKASSVADVTTAVGSGRNPEHRWLTEHAEDVLRAMRTGGKGWVAKRR